MSRPIFSLGARGRFTLILLGLLVAANGRAEELQLGIDSQLVYNSNFFSSSTNREDAFSLQIGPSIELSDPDGRFRYDLAFTGAYQVYLNQSGVNAWESRLRGERAEQLRLHALWLHVGLDAVEPAILRRCLAAADGRVRAAAIRVVRDWLDRIPGGPRASA